MPRFSIIVPMYNVERYVGECLASLVRQSFADFEAVCVDDGSTDATLERAREAVRGDSRFVFVERENGGLSAARNSGLAAATGEFVCFLDSDDRYVPDALERIDRAIAEGDLDLLDFSARTFYEGEEAREAHEETYEYRDPVPGVFAGQDLFVLYWEKLQFVASACLHAIRRDLLEGDGPVFCEGLLHEDELFSPVLYARASRASFLDAQLYERRVRLGSIMATPASMKRVTSLAAISQLLHAWLIENADELTPDFIDAFARDVAYIRDAACRASSEVDPDELSAYLAGLDAVERAEFDLACRFGSEPAEGRFREVAESRDYRLGRVALAAPRALKHVIGRVKR